MQNVCVFISCSHGCFIVTWECRHTPVFKTHIPFVLFSWRVCIAVCDRHLEEICRSTHLAETAQCTVEGAITQSSHSVTRMVVSTPLQPGTSEIQPAFSSSPVNTDQSYPGIRTARMCRQPGCRYFCTRLFPISPSSDKFAVENELYILAPSGQTLTVPNHSKPG